MQMSMVYIRTEPEVLMYRGKKNVEDVLKIHNLEVVLLVVKQKINLVKEGQILGCPSEGAF